eukprot:m.44162 g.44162  ORF g.44162 m.44162 type:complete len:335 (+) comp10055_c0_seq2:70-1074(+)
MDELSELTAAIPDTDFDEYFKRIFKAEVNWKSFQPSEEVLFRIHEAHFCTIPFENLDVFKRLHGPDIHLHSQALRSKFFNSATKRGGYCFEQNSVLAAVLCRIGYHVEMLEARVLLHLGTTPVYRSGKQRGHVVLHVRLPTKDEANSDSIYMCDVGFGRLGPQVPLKLNKESPTRIGHSQWEIRKVEIAGLTFNKQEFGVWHKQPDSEWERAFVYYPQNLFYIMDCVSPNCFTCYDPTSSFTQGIWISKRQDNVEVTLFRNEIRIIEDTETGVTTDVTAITNGKQLQQTVFKHFEIDLDIELAESLVKFTAIEPGKLEKYHAFARLKNTLLDSM